MAPLSWSLPTDFIPTRFGIGARLGLAFVAIVGLAVAACIVGWLSYLSLSGELSRIASAQLPRLAFATRLSQIGAELNAVMPNLANAPSRTDYAVYRRDYADSLRRLDLLIDEMTLANAAPAQLTPLVEAINQSLPRLDVAVGKRFTLAEEMRAETDDLRWIQADLIDESDPLVEDTRFNMATVLKAQQAEALFLEEQKKNEALLSLVAEANLAIGLLGRLVATNSLEASQDTLAFLGDNADRLFDSKQALTGWPDSITVRQIAERILAAADERSGLPNLKRSELAELEKALAIAEENRKLVEDLAERIRSGVAAAEQDARASAVRAQGAIDVGAKVLFAIALTAVLAALGVGYFYVHRNLLRRIADLASVAGRISAGRGAPALIVESRDELGELALALNVFRQTRDELIQSAKLAALGQMAAGIGHELNQPLAAIRSHSHNAMRRIERGEAEKGLQNLDKIRDATLRMSAQLDQLRRFARLPDARLATVDLAAVLTDAIGLLAHRFEDEDVDLAVELPSGLPVQVTAETVRLEQVFVNVLANALDAITQSERRLISVLVARNGQLVEIRIRDSGPGISSHDVGSIFDPFFTTKPASSGLGLGLSISYNIIRDFDGMISVASTSVEGTEFLITLHEADR